jgi:hypothetical protein
MHLSVMEILSSDAEVVPVATKHVDCFQTAVHFGNRYM